MVWIHGGGFIAGDGNGETGFYGPDYLLDRDIVLVTFNYRLGPFGKKKTRWFVRILPLLRQMFLRLPQYGRCGSPW